MSRSTNNTALYGQTFSYKSARIAIRACASLILLCALVTSVLAQGSTSGMTPPGMAPGAPAGSYSMSGFENVNLYSGNLNFNLPLLKIGGRGRVGTSVNFALNSIKWNVVRFPQLGELLTKPEIFRGVPLDEGDYKAFDFGVSQVCVSVVCESECSVPKCGIRDNYSDWNPSGPLGLTYRLPMPSGATPRYAFFPVARPELGGDIIPPGYGPGVLRARYSSAREEWAPIPNTGQTLSETELQQYHYIQSLYRLTFVDPDGTEHELVDAQTNGKPVFHTFAQPVNRGKVFTSTDGSGMTFVSDQDIFDDYGDPTGHLFFADGTRCRIENGLIYWVRDTDGNQVNYTYGLNTEDRPSYGKVTEISDTLGRKVTITYADLKQIWETNAVLYDEIKFNGIGGELNRSIKVWHSQMSNAMRSDQTLKTVGELFTNVSRVDSPVEIVPEKFNPLVTSAIELPDGRKYQLKYNSYGELARVEMPTGAAIEYDYPTQSYVSFLQIKRRVEERRVSSDGVNWESKQLFTLAGTSGAADDIAGWETAVTVETRDVKGGGNRLASKTKHYFHSYPLFANSPELFYPSWLDGREYKVEQLDTAGAATTVLRREERQWQQRYKPSWWGQASNPPLSGYQLNDSNAPGRDPRVVTTVTTIEPEGANLVLKKTSIDPTDPDKVGFDEFNNRTDLWEYDYGSPGQVGALLRHTHTDYVKTLSINGTTYDYRCDPLTTCGQSANVASLIHIRNLPQAVEVTDAVTSKTVSRSEFRYDEPVYLADDYGILPTNFPGWVGPSILTRGHPTTSRVWLDTLGDKLTESAYLEGHTQYDRFGNAVKAWDAQGKISEVIFDPVHKYALVKETKSPDPDGNGPLSSLTTVNTYDPYSGVLRTTTDANGKTTELEYNDNDLLDRLAKIKRPDGGWTTYEYGDQVGNLYLHTKTLRDVTLGVEKTLESYQFLDGMGRGIRATSRISENVWTAGITEYDGVGRAVKATNPYEASDYQGLLLLNPSQPVLWTTTDYDNLGRAWMVTTPDGAKVYTLFDGVRTLVTDQAGKQRISRTDAFGRLLDVWEVRSADPAGGTEAVAFPVPQGISVPAVSAGYRTSYAYDVLGNLRKVEQGSQRRFFAYDSLSRLIRVKNPEQEASIQVQPTLALTPDMLSSLSENNNNWSLKYEYDEGGNLKKRTDARGFLTEYTYDDLNRLTFRNYSDSTPDVTYTYDTLVNGKGRFSSVGSSVSTTTYGGYDVMGRVTSSTQTTGVTYPTQEYTYDLAGNLKTQKYPSGRIVTTEYDPAGRLKAVIGQKTNEQDKTYASEVTYTPAGAVKDLQLGNGLWEQTIYNSRLQVEKIRLGTTPGGINRLNLTYSYGTSDNNGNVKSQTITVPTIGATVGFTYTQSYSYDALNRLESAAEMSDTTQLWKQSFAYDRFGNRTIDTGLDQNSIKKTSDNLKPTLLSDNPTLNPLNNQISVSQGYGYEGAGNLVSVPNRADPTKSYKYEYDAENHQISFDRDPVGTPNQKDAEYVYDGDGRRVKKVVDGETTIFVYDASGRLVAEYSSAGSNGGGTSYLTSDTLGTPRVITGSDINDANGGVEARHDYLPFGEELFIGRSSYAGDNVRQKFTGYERDIETNLDYAQARYYSSSQGRFTSVDPLLASGNPGQPQSWNRYTYTLNNPLNYTDPSGLDPVWVTNGKDYRVFLTDQAYKSFLDTDESWDWYRTEAGARFKLHHLSADSDSEWYQRNKHLEGKEVVTGADGNFHEVPVNPSLFNEQFLPAMQQHAAAIEPYARYSFYYMSLFTGPVSAGGAASSLGLEAAENGLFLYHGSRAGIQGGKFSLEAAAANRVSTHMTSKEAAVFLTDDLQRAATQYATPVGQVGRSWVSRSFAESLKQLDRYGNVEFMATTQRQLNILNRTLEIKSQREAILKWWLGR